MFISISVCVKAKEAFVITGKLEYNQKPFCFGQMMKNGLGLECVMEIVPGRMQRFAIL